MVLFSFYLCADLVAALAGLHVDDLAHGCVGVVVVGGGEEEGRELRGRPDGRRAMFTGNNRLIAMEIRVLVDVMKYCGLRILVPRGDL